MVDDTFSEFLTTREAGEMLRCSRKTVARLAEVGKLRGRRRESPNSPINRRSRWLIERRSVEEFLGKGARRPRKPGSSAEALALLKAMGIKPLHPHGRYGPKNHS